MTVKVKEELSHICQIIAETVDAENIYLFGSYKRSISISSLSFIYVSISYVPTPFSHFS